MPVGQTPESNSAFKNPLLYSSIALAIAVLVVGGILFFRWQNDKEFDRRAAEERSQKQHQADQAAIEQLGGKEFAIQSFYASAGVVKPGETIQLCYGVANAKTVTLQPQDNPVWPSPNRCVDVAPKKTTTYTLTITNAMGETKSQTLDVKVR